MKKIIHTSIEHSALIEMVIDEVHDTVCMVKNKSTHIVKCEDLAFPIGSYCNPVFSCLHQLLVFLQVAFQVISISLSNCQYRENVIP